MKYVILLASVLIQVCLGGLYAWSSFVPALHALYGLSTAQTQIIFGSLIAFFASAMVFSGRLIEHRGPRFVAITGGVLFSIGYLTASFSDGSFPVLLFGIGILAGTGTGFVYVCPVAACIKWFPDRKGLVMGIAVAGFGGGAVLLSGFAEFFLLQGTDVQIIFRGIGIFYGIAILMAALVLKFPIHSKVKHSRQSPMLCVLLRDPFFMAMTIGMFCGTFAGLLVIGNLKPMALSAGIPPFIASAAVSSFAMGNASGRIIWGWVADRLGERAVPLSLGVIAVSLGLTGLVSTSPLGAVGVSILVGFGFGACFSVYAAQIAARYGPEKFGNVYPLVFLAYGAAGIAGPWAGGWLYDITGSYASAIAISITVVLAGLLVCVWLLRKANFSARKEER